jgi:O-antigen/teichoic acid export membrane protein
LTTYTIIAIGKQKIMIKYYLSAAVLAVIGYILLIPRYSYFAAAWITVAVELLMLMFTLFILKRYAKLKIHTRPLGKAMLSAVIMGFVLNYLREGNVIVLIIIGALIYLGILVLTKTIDGNFLKDLRKKD